MEIYKKQTLAETFSVYFDRRMIKILLLGAISGFPWVIAIINPILITSAKFVVGLITLHKIKLIRIIVCIKTIHPRLCPILFVNQGILTLSIIGAHK